MLTTLLIIVVVTIILVVVVSTVPMDARGKQVAYAIVAVAALIALCAALLGTLRVG